MITEQDFVKAVSAVGMVHMTKKKLIEEIEAYKEVLAICPERIKKQTAIEILNLVLDDVQRLKDD